MSKQDTWLEAALRGLDKELGGAIGPLSDQDIMTAKAMVLVTLRKAITADPAAFRNSLESNAEAAAKMLREDVAHPQSMSTQTTTASAMHGKTTNDPDHNFDF